MKWCLCTGPKIHKGSKKTVYLPQLTQNVVTYVNISTIGSNKEKLIDSEI